MMRRFFLNLSVNLSAGFVLFFLSERLFWTIYKPGDHLGDLTITWLAYSVLACIFLNIVKRLQVQTVSRVVLAGAIYGWLTEGALVGTLYGTESSAPFPISIVQTALSWHMLISVVVGWWFLIGAVRRGDVRVTSFIAIIVGLFWAAWAPFQWRETPPVVMPISMFAAHAAVGGALLAVAVAILSGQAWREYKPGWFGLGFSMLVLAIFYNEQVKALGVRPLVVLPCVVGITMLLLRWTKPNVAIDIPQEEIPARRRWFCSALILLMPLTATLVYGLQLQMGVKGVPSALIFHSLAWIGGTVFLAACAFLVARKAKIRRAGLG